MTMETLTAVEARPHGLGKKGMISDRALIFYHARSQRRVLHTYMASFTPNSPFATLSVVVPYALLHNFWVVSPYFFANIQGKRCTGICFRTLDFQSCIIDLKNSTEINLNLKYYIYNKSDNLFQILIWTKKRWRSFSIWRSFNNHIKEL